MNNKALIIGGDHYNTLGIVESLGQKGIKSYVILHGENIGKRMNYVLKSKFIIKGWVCKTDEEVLMVMRSEFHDTGDKRTIVFPSRDADACLVDACRDELVAHFILPGASGRIRQLISKQEMAKLAESVKVNIPETWTIGPDRIIPENLIYPCITKAISSVDGHKDDMCVCHNEKELQSFLDKRPKNLTVLVQKFIKKAFEFQLMGCSMQESGEVIIPGRSHLNRPNGIDNAYFLWYGQCDSTFDNTIAKAHDFIRLTGYSGLFSLEYLRDKDGKDYFMEMNFRNDGNSIAVTDAGTNLPYIWWLYYSGGKWQEELNSSTVKETYWQPETYYFRNIFTKEITIKEWWINLKRTNSFSIKFKEDKRPWRWFWLCECVHVLKKVFSK